LALVALLASSCIRSRPSETEPSDGRAAAESANLTPPLDARTVGWEMGRRYGYQLKMTSQVSFGDGANSFDFDVTGNLELQPTANRDGATTMYMLVSDGRITSRIPGSQKEFDKLAEQLNSTACFVKLEGGRVSEMRVAKGLSPILANTFRTVAAQLQFSRPVQPSKHYRAEEFDSTGRYVAEYESTDDANHWRKQKRRYLELLGTNDDSNAVRVMPEIGASTGEITLSSGGRPVRITSRDAIVVKGAQQPVRSEVSVSLTSVVEEATTGASPDFDKLLAQTERIAANEAYGLAAAATALDTARMEGLVLEKVVSRLEELAKDQDDLGLTGGTNGAALDPAEKERRERLLQERTRLFVGLGAMIRQKPESIGKLVARVKAKSPATDVLIDALGSASSPAAEEALLDLIHSKSTRPEVKTLATNALTKTAAPTSKAIEELKAKLLADPTSTQALFALGTYSRQLRDHGKSEEASQVGDFLVARLREAKASSDTVAVLRALANSGYTAALPSVQPFLSDERELVRSVAVQALQSMQGPKIDELIAHSIETDPSRDVRLSAIDAAHARRPTDVLVRSLVSTSTTSPDPHVRYRCLELMINWKTVRPELRVTFDRIAKTDEEERIRERAKAALL
jgi:hypothetical protein